MAQQSTIQTETIIPLKNEIIYSKHTKPNPKLSKRFLNHEAPNKLDHLKLGDNKKIEKMLFNHGECFPDKEIVWYSNKITKINPKQKRQQRILLITDKAIYNLANDYKYRRRICLDDIESITKSIVSQEFVLHVPSEYDYRYISPNKNEMELIFKIIEYTKKRKCNKTLSIIPTQQASLISLMVSEDKYREAQKRSSKNAKKSVSPINTKPTHKKSKSGFWESAWKDQMEQRERRYMELRKNMQGLSNITEDEMREYLQDSNKNTREFNAKGSMDEFNNNNNEPESKVSINDFDLIKVIGRGSFGKVMQVRMKDSDEIYAMKILRKDYIIKRNQVEHTIGERSILEACDHPFLMHLRYAFQTKQKLYFVLDYYRGGELFFHLKKKRKFSIDCARIWVAETALALGHLHSLNVIYRDLKPENILLDDNGHICLTDFGLSKELENKDKDNDNDNDNNNDNNKNRMSNDMAYTFCGTPEYLAPEIVLNIGHNRSVDWWSLGVLLYELSVGLPPFYSHHPNEMYQKIQKDPIQFPSFMPIQCQSCISLLLERDIKKRLGAGKDDVKEIQRHSFFKDLDWNKLYNKEIDPPYKPDLKKSNFEKQFTAEPVVDSYTANKNNELLEKNHDAFLQFTFQPNGQNDLFLKE